MARPCVAAFLGRMKYREVLALQMALSARRKAGHGEDVLLLLEHTPVITLGRNGRREHLLVAAEELNRRGVECVDVDRGGDITFHGPGQLVGYPILHLEGGERDVRRYMWKLEESLIRLVGEYGIEAYRVEKLTGVWTGRGKVAAFGVHISRWVTRHGFALNVSTDLSFFDLIVPCGITGKGVTSIERLTGRAPGLEETARSYVRYFSDLLDRKVEWVQPDYVWRFAGAGAVPVPGGDSPGEHLAPPDRVTG